MTHDISFAAPWDRLTQVVTSVVVLLLAAIEVNLIWDIIKAGSAGATLPWLLAAFIPLVVVVIPFLLSPRGYRITPSGMEVQRPIGAITIRWNQIANIEAVNGETAFAGAVRYAASGGLFGYFGIFHNSSLGTFRAYCTRTDDVVVITRTKGSPVVLSPDNSSAFEDAAMNMRQAA